MSLVQAVILGLIQGLTEFLPVSSSGHLVVAQTFFNLASPPILFDILVHVGTLIAVFIFFKKEIFKLNTHQIKLIIIGTVPAIIVGLLIEPAIETLFSSLSLVALSLLVTASLLFVTKYLHKENNTINKLSNKNAIIIGIFQALAILPGISRSGSTVSAGLFTGLKKSAAFSFSFLLSIPAIIGALVLHVKDYSQFTYNNLTPSLIGMLISAITGFMALKILKIIIRKAKLHYFAYYCLFLSITLLSYLSFANQ